MSDDVTIPRETAQRYARELRHGGMTPWTTDALADLLDPPPQPSLRDEVLLAIDPTNGGGWEGEADAVLAVMRKHVEALPAPTGDRVSSWLHWRDDVLRLLGGAE